MTILESLSDEELQIIEKRLLHYPLLKIEGIDKEDIPYKSPKAGLKYVITQLTKRNTINAKSHKYQCSASRRRSAGDIFRIMRYYYPKSTFKSVRSLLYDMISKKELSSLYCCTINKRVFYRNRDLYGSPHYNEGAYDESFKDEHKSILIIKHEEKVCNKGC